MAATVEIRDRDLAERWLAGGLCLARLARPDADIIRSAAPWLVAALGETAGLPPAGVIADIGHMLLGASLDFAAPLDVADPRLRAAIRAYEDQVLGRLAADAHLEAAVDAAARLGKPDLRPTAVAILVAQILSRLEFSAGVAVSPGVVRRLAERPADEALSEGFTALGSESVVAQLAAGYEGLVHAARRARSLLADSDVFTLENLEVLGSLTQRLASAQVLEAAEAIDRTLPRRLKRRGGSRAGVAPTQLEDDSAYPTGGFSALSTSGSLENLVTSELIYMDDAADDIDLFDMRYVEGELLYYTRDESILVRRRRSFTFVLHPELAGARWKDAGLPWQRVVLVLALVVASVRRLVGWLTEEALAIRVVFPWGASARPALAPERDLLTLLLGEWRDHGILEVVEARSTDEVMRAVAADARGALCDVVHLTMGEPRVEPLATALRGRVRRAVLDVGEAAPRLSLPDRPPAPRERREAGDAFQAWAEAALDLLEQII